MTERWDAIVIGAGHNGLACAALLARSGRRVLVLEASSEPGGAAANDEFAPGFTASSCAHFIYQLHDAVHNELELDKHGLRFAPTALDTISLGADGRHTRLTNHAVLSDASQHDREGIERFSALMNRFGRFMQPLLGKPPPLPINGTRADKLALAKLGLDLRRMGKDDMRDFLRVIAINIYDLLNEYIDSDAIKGALAADAVLGTHLGPRSPNTVLTYLHRVGASAAANGPIYRQPVGGMGAVGAAFAAAARAAGATIQTDTLVSQIRVVDGRAVGVELGDGSVRHSDTIISNADPKTTLLELLGARHLDIGFTRRVKNIRMRGNAAKLHFALDGLPDVAGLRADDLGQRLLIAPDMDYLERAFNPAKYGEISLHPMVEMQVASINDPSLAPAGGHVLSAIVQYAPYNLEGGWDDAARERLYQTTLTTLETVLPGLRKHIRAAQTLTPLDLEIRHAMHGGHWHHGELTLDQFLFVRPTAKAAQYATPIGGLFLCGAGCHPGGGISGAAGRNAARVILARTAS